MFSALVDEAGGRARTLPVVPDEPAAIAAAIRSAVEDGADLVILNAGSSAGSHDYSADVIREMGELLVHGVAVMPGKPLRWGWCEPQAVRFRLSARRGIRYPPLWPWRSL